MLRDNLDQRYTHTDLHRDEERAVGRKLLSAHDRARDAGVRRGIGRFVEDLGGDEEEDDLSDEAPVLVGEDGWLDL